MSKTVRINTEMRFINNRQQFTIHDLMVEFKISRSTAIRDLREIEELGLPLLSVAGHNGGYQVIRNQTLPAVTFTATEIQALFVAFIATANSQLPYLKNRQAISEKLLSIVPQAKQEELLRLRQLLWFENTNPDDPNLLELTDTAPAILGELVSRVVVTPQLTIAYQKAGDSHAVNHEVYVLHLYLRQQVWYVECYDLTRKAKRTLRVDRIQQLNEMTKPLLSRPEVNTLLRANAPDPNVVVELGPQAVGRFRRFHQPGRRLEFLDAFQQTAILTDYLGSGKDAAKMYADWLLFLGEDLKIRQLPTEVWQAIQRKSTYWNGICQHLREP